MIKYELTILVITLLSLKKMSNIVMKYGEDLLIYQKIEQIL